LTKRVNVTLPDKIYEKLLQRADEQGRSAANLAAFVIEKYLIELDQAERQTGKYLL
jgi:predicted DNA-binding protein